MLRITNTLTRQKEEFKPLKDKQVSFYHCGPTVYWVQHIGNMRAMVMADIIRRTLKYLGYDVKMARNYTDVGHLTGDNVGDADTGEDRMAKAAKRENLSPDQIADKYIKIFVADLEALNIETPEFRPRATEEIPEMIAMVQALIDKGFAYTTDLGVYFDVTKFKAYGELSGQSLADKLAGSGKGEVSDPGKQHPADFAVWLFKAGEHKNALQTWPSPFQSKLVASGEGFPGWHLECSVMAKKYLGDTLDIHMGGMEHIPIHHTNEIAQSEAANGVKFVNYWLHNEWLEAGDAKLSKSAGDNTSVQTIIDKGYNPLALRYFYLNAHYRSKQNFSWQALDAAQTTLDNLYERVAEMGEAKIGSSSAKAAADTCAEFEQRFQEALEDDFNTPQALAVMWDLLKSDYPGHAKKASLLKFDQVLGLKLDEIKKEEIKIPAEVQKLVDERESARENMNFDLSDKLRKEIEDKGFSVEDTDQGPKIKKIK